MNQNGQDRVNLALRAMYEALREDHTIYLCQTHADEALAILPTLHIDRVPLIFIDADSCIHCYM